MDIFLQKGSVLINKLLLNVLSCKVMQQVTSFEYTVHVVGL